MKLSFKESSFLTDVQSLLKVLKFLFLLDISCLSNLRVVYNFSDYKLTEKEKSVLCKGLEFAISPSKLEYADFMLPFELLFRDIKNNDLSIPQTKAVKSKILDTAFSSFDSFNNNKMRSNLSKEELKALHDLRKPKHLVIQKADKGNTVVITEKNA